MLPFRLFENGNIGGRTTPRWWNYATTEAAHTAPNVLDPGDTESAGACFIGAPGLHAPGHRGARQAIGT